MKRFISLLLTLLFLGTMLISCTEQNQDSSLALSEAEESSQAEESKPVIIINTDPNYANVALNKSYEKSSLYPADAPSYPDEGNKSMTDGIRPSASASYSDKAFMAFNRNSLDYPTTGYSSLTVDLGDIYYVDKFVANVASSYYDSVGIGAPSYAWIMLSNDGKEWYRAGQTSHTDDNTVNTLESTLVLDSALTARYIQYRFVVGAAGWIFVSEVEAFGIKADAPIDYPEIKEEKKILFVGNSSTYYFNIPDKVYLLAESAGVNIVADYCCRGSAYLSYFADETHELGKIFREKIKAKKYDIVVLQDNSGADNAESKPAVEVLAKLIRETGAEVALYKRYSSNDDPTQRLDSAYRHQVNYTQLAKDFSIEKVAPGADAFLICTQKYPNINLYFTDNSHHGETGAYLLACTLAKTMLGLDLSKATYTAGLDEATVNALKDCANIACEQGFDYPQDNK